MANVLITGASRGIGLALCRHYQERGDTIIAVCREPSAALKELGVRIEAGVDVTRDADIARLTERLRGLPIHILINNAGLLTRETIDDLDLDRIRAEIEINALGPLRITKALLPNLDKGAKIALITSRMGSIADNTSGSYYGYRMSKAALNMAGVTLAHDLAPRGIAVAILHPGWIRTDMTGMTGNADPDQAAVAMLRRIDELDMETSGGFWHANGERLPW